MQQLCTVLLVFMLFSCNNENNIKDKEVTSNAFERLDDLIISREDYADQLYGFWLGQCIANWTGLVTEMDKIGNIGDIKTGDFYTSADWGKPDLASIWSDGVPSDLSPTISFVFRDTNEVWGADDDTDIEYMYQHLLYTHQVSYLTPDQIRNGWLKHMKLEEENYLWVSNQKALDLMVEGLLPPDTGDPKHNEHYEMIDAQLTTEIFGLFAPGRPDIAMEMARLPIQTVARMNAEYISNFYVTMHALASNINKDDELGEQLINISQEARKVLPDLSYAAKMYDYVRMLHATNIPWEQTRDSIYYRYQVKQKDGYDMTAKKLYCNACFAGGINFAASLVSLFYGEGDIIKTIKIGTLAGWDSDNPTATWGGLIGFILGKEGVEKAFNTSFSNRFNIHRTRINFPNNGLDTFDEMAKKALEIIDRVVLFELNGSINKQDNSWEIPVH